MARRSGSAIHESDLHLRWSWAAGDFVERISASHLATVWEDVDWPDEEWRHICRETGVELMFGKMQRINGLVVEIAYLADTKQLFERTARP